MKNAVKQSVLSLSVVVLLLALASVAHAKDPLPKPNQPSVINARRSLTTWLKVDSDNPQYVPDSPCEKGKYGTYPTEYTSRDVEGGINPWFRCTSSMAESYCGQAQEQVVVAYERWYKSDNCNPKDLKDPNRHAIVPRYHHTAELKPKIADTSENGL